MNFCYMCKINELEHWRPLWNSVFLDTALFKVQIIIRAYVNSYSYVIEIFYSPEKLIVVQLLNYLTNNKREIELSVYVDTKIPV